MSEEERLKSFFSQSTSEVAQQLLGKLLTYRQKDRLLTGYIVETEAYLGVTDQACHSYLGKRTPKVEAMYQEAGTIYVYSMHTHNMLNFVTEEVGNPQAVLIRGLEPVAGLELMAANRRLDGIAISNGPGKMTKALGITRELNQQHLQTSTLRLDLDNSRHPKKIIASPRIGIPNKGEWTAKPLRYYVAGNPYVSNIKKSETTSQSWQD